MIHRFIDLLPVPGQFPFLAFEASPALFFAVWKAGFESVAEGFNSTRISSLNSSNDYLADVDPWPLDTDGGPVLYSRAGHNLTPKKNSVRKVEWDDSANVELFAETGAEVLSLQPNWKPDGTQIVFRALATTGTRLAKINVMDADGTNLSTLYESAAGTRVTYPSWSPDSTKIAWLEYLSTDLLFPRHLKVMNADGSGVANLYTPSPAAGRIFEYHAWANGSNVLAFHDMDSTAFSATRRWSKVTTGGSVTTLLTINRSSGYGPGDSDPAGLDWTWLPDDSAIVTWKQTPADPSPDHYLTFIDAAGGGATVVTAVAIGTGNADARPFVLNGRVYVPGVINAAGVDSTALDGSGIRVEFDGSNPATSTSVVFHGVKGDTINT